MELGTVYFWSPETGTLDLSGRYEPNRREVRLPGIHTLECRPEIDCTGPPPESLVVGLVGLLWRVEDGEIRDMVPVGVEAIRVNLLARSGYKARVDFFSRGPFVLHRRIDRRTSAVDRAWTVKETTG